MSNWTRFKDEDGDDVILTMTSGYKLRSGEVYVHDKNNHSWCVHPDDADRVWGILCAMCEPDHSADANAQDRGMVKPPIEPTNFVTPKGAAQKTDKLRELLRESEHITTNPPPLTYSRRTLADGDTEIVLRSFTHKRVRDDLCVSSSGVTICSFEYPEWCGYTSPKLLYVTGRVAEEDKRPILIPAADWPNVEDALREYGAVEVQP